MPQLYFWRSGGGAGKGEATDSPGAPAGLAERFANGAQGRRGQFEFEVDLRPGRQLDCLAGGGLAKVASGEEHGGNQGRGEQAA